MSSESFIDDCPNCGKNMECSRGSSPLDTFGSCMYCGYYYQIIAKQMGIRELNELRKEFNEACGSLGDAHALQQRKLRILTKLPRMKKSLVL